jgi:quercetin dioxygenase-like cupin family protein
MATDAKASGVFNLTDEIERFQPGETHAGRRAETLVKTEHLRVVLVTMHAGAVLQEHAAPGPITIQALTGRFTVTGNGETVDLPAGSLAAFAEGVRHSVAATDEGAFLLTIAWPGARSA